MADASKDGKPATDQVQGEGDYEAARRYDQNVERCAKSGQVDQAARDAAPKSGAEAEAMKDAEAEGKSHSKGEDSSVKGGKSGR